MIVAVEVVHRDVLRRIRAGHGLAPEASATMVTQQALDTLEQKRTGSHARRGRRHVAEKAAAAEWAGTLYRRHGGCRRLRGLTAPARAEKTSARVGAGLGLPLRDLLL